MSDTNKLTSPPFAQMYNCVNSTQFEPVNFSDADLGLSQEQMTAVPATTILDATLDATEYTVANPCAGGWSTVSEWMEETEVASPTPADVASLVALIQEIRTSNTNLLERTIELEQALADSQGELQLQTARSHNAESLLSEKIDTLAAFQKQFNCVSKQLETAHQTIQHQQASIKNLTTQLATNSERIAQMERECSLTQANYNEKSHQLIQSENSCQELRSRLIRQQRYTMQLKVALEKSLDSPRSYQSQDNSDFCSQAQSIFPQAQPITPWSVPTSSFTNELESSWSGSTVERQTYFDCTPCSTSVEQGFFFTKDVDVDREDSNWQDLFNLVDEAETETNNSEIDLFITNTLSTSDAESLAEFSWSVDEPGLAFNPNSKSISDALPQTNQFQRQNSTEPETIPSQGNSNWPSPVVYPLHPPKGRKSLSAIELPKFSQKRK